MRDIAERLVAALGLAVLSPVLAMIAMLVRRDSRGPVLFRQERVGQFGRTFQILKFRTMRVSDGGPDITASGDARITRVGGWLRSTKLDELPQLVNVARGEMGIVGPRPELPRYVAEWPAADREIILSVRPGITDPASIAFRRESELLAAAPDPGAYYVDVLLVEKVRLYRAYVLQRTLRGDLGIVLRTLVSVVRS